MTATQNDTRVYQNPAAANLPRRGYYEIRGEISSVELISTIDFQDEALAVLTLIDAKGQLRVAYGPGEWLIQALGFIWPQGSTGHHVKVGVINHVILSLQPDERTDAMDRKAA